MRRHDVILQPEKRIPIYCHGKQSYMEFPSDPCIICVRPSIQNYA
jgi:hypothetical protein